ncbi:MAG: LTA synthase family protein [Chloroflexota bacterium]|nr:LTA synthase family protein [Chloroflexota bacterium]
MTISAGIRRALLAALVAYLAFAGYILGRFANSAFPSFYLIRPLLLVIPLAVLIGLLAAWLWRSQAPLAAAGAAGLIFFWATTTRHLLEVAALGAAWLVLVFVARRLGRAMPLVPRQASAAATAFVLVFFVSGVVRAFLSAEGPIAPVTASRVAAGPNIYLVLLDGYPRRDTLMNAMGIDNGPFEEALEARGFDLYGDAHTDRRYTDLTLMSLLTGSLEGVPLDTAPASEVQWLVRRALSDAALPRAAQEAGYEWDIIDSPAGHVTFSAGTHFQHGGINTFEDNILAESVLGPIVKALLPYLLTDSLRDHFEGSVESLVSLADPAAHRLVLAHLFQPHLPFLWDADGDQVPVPAHWPRVNIFAAQIETMGMTLDEYSAAMKGDLATLNRKLLAMVDAIVAKDPGAVLVLFSDHGARYSLDLRQSEWYRSFLAARTPGHPLLFAVDPVPTAILRTLLPIYVTGAGP